MKAMIFAAGLGSRLKPITDTIPKALVAVNNITLLEHTIIRLKETGFDEIIINVHHFADQIISFLYSKNNFDIRIEISDERDQLLETGGGIKKASHFFNDDTPFLIHNVDILSNVNLFSFYEYMINNHCTAALVVSQRNSSRYLLFNENNDLAGWINEKTGEIKSPYKNLNLENYKKYAFGGIHMLSPCIFNWMNDNWQGSFSIIDFYLSLCDQTSIKGFIQQDLELIDVGKPDALDYLNKKRYSF